jgi:hypothetical protein
VQEHQGTSRRTALKGGAAVAAGLAGLAAAATPANAASGTHILAGLGVNTTSYTPAITATPASVGFTADDTFTPPLPCAGNLLLLAVANHYSGTMTTSCLGTVSSPTLGGYVRWSDLTVSNYTVTYVSAERVEGHLVGRFDGTITSGHYTGAVIRTLLIKLGGNLTACLTGGSISNSAGAAILMLTMP